MSEIQRVLEIAKRLLAEGFATNEADARLAAVKIIVAAERLAPPCRDADAAMSHP